jgi:hypothetical protein
VTQGLKNNLYKNLILNSRNTQSVFNVKTDLLRLFIVRIVRHIKGVDKIWRYLNITAVGTYSNQVTAEL